MDLNNPRDKKGSVTVFVCIFFVTLVSAIFTFAKAAERNAVNSACGSLCGLWADSVLAEYDLNLQKRYNVFGFYGCSADVMKKIDFYAGESFRSKAYLAYEGSRCSLYDFSLINPDCLKPQIEKAGMISATDKFRKPEKEIIGIEGATGAESRIFDDLPSAGTDKSFSVSAITSLLTEGKTPGQLLQKGTGIYGQVQYLFNYFKDRSDQRELGRTYLQNEIEYVLFGKYSDERNLAKVRNRIIAVREVVNFAYLQKDPEKSGAALAAAEILTPGSAAAATQKAILAAWALAESVNDYKLLISGYRVQPMKTANAWATDLDSVLANQEENCIFTGVDEGQDYQDYLRLFLYAMDERVRLLRIMDLIQINMRYLYYDGFLLRDYNGGVRFVITVNGEEHETEKTYEARQLSG